MRLIIICVILISNLVPLEAQRQDLKSVGIVDSKRFLLDSVTAYPFTLGGKFEYCNDISAVAYLNRISSSIKYFDYTTGRTLPKETRLITYGPNALGREPINFHYHNKDSIFIISSGSNFKLFLLNQSGEKLADFNYSSDDYTDRPFPVVGRVTDVMSLNKHYLYIAVQAGKYKNRNKVSPIVRIDLRDNSFEYLEAPRAYQNIDVDLLPDNNQPEFYNTTLAFDSKRKRFLINYPMDHDVYQLDASGVKRIPMASSLLGEMKFLPKSRKRFKHRDFPLMDVIINSSRYIGVLHDPYKDLIYRIAKVSGETASLRRQLNGEKIKRPFEYSIAVYDSSFKLIGESILKGGNAYFERGFFLGPDGLWAIRVNDRGEDVMEFARVGLIDEGK